MEEVAVNSSQEIIESVKRDVIFNLTMLYRKLVPSITYQEENIIKYLYIDEPEEAYLEYKFMEIHTKAVIDCINDIVETLDDKHNPDEFWSVGFKILKCQESIMDKIYNNSYAMLEDITKNTKNYKEKLMKKDLHDTMNHIWICLYDLFSDILIENKVDFFTYIEMSPAVKNMLQP